MIPVTYHNGELAGLLALHVPDSMIQRGYISLKVGRSVEVVVLDVPVKLEEQIVTMNFGMWLGRGGEFVPCIQAPAGWTLDQLRQLEYFR